MVDIKTAVAAAVEFAKHLLGPERTASIRLEELESARAKGEEVWLITLSMPTDRPLGMISGAHRDYKVFTVSKATGEVLAMKVRLLTAQ